MKIIPADNIAAAAVCALAIASFGVTPQVRADAVFPPAHVAADAHFAAAAAEPARLGSPSWYRVGDVSRSPAEVRISDGTTVAEVTVGAWYRGTN